jgi:hypothetical protein
MLGYDFSKSRSSEGSYGLEDFYRNTVYIPMLDNIIADITGRFSDHFTNSLNINVSSENQSNFHKLRLGYK